MLALQPTSYTAVNVLTPASKADTAAATSAWIDISAYDGPIIFVVRTGAITGSMAAKIRTATDSGGTGAADVKTVTTISTANQTQVIVVNSDACAGFIAFVGTVTTGPIILDVVMLVINQYS